MKIVIQTKNVKLSPVLREYVREKINSLEKFAGGLFGKDYFDHFFTKGKPKVEVWVEIGKTGQHHRKGPFFRAECQMRFPGQSIRAEARSKDLKLAINEIKDELQREIKEYKEKLKTKIERETRKAKKDLKISPQARFYRKGRIKEEGT